MDFLKSYIKFCIEHKVQNMEDGYTSTPSFEKRPKGVEIHHILPKCLNGAKKKFKNLVCLSFEDHVVAHLLLQLALVQYKCKQQAKRHCLKSTLTYKQFMSNPYLKNQRYVLGYAQYGDHSWTLLQMLTNLAIHHRGNLSSIKGKNKMITLLLNNLSNGTIRIACKRKIKNISFPEFQKTIVDGVQSAMKEHVIAAYTKKEEFEAITLTRDFVSLDLQKLEMIRNNKFPNAAQFDMMISSI